MVRTFQAVARNSAPHFAVVRQGGRHKDDTFGPSPGHVLSVEAFTASRAASDVDQHNVLILFPWIRRTEPGGWICFGNSRNGSLRSSKTIAESDPPWATTRTLCVKNVFRF